MIWTQKAYENRFYSAVRFCLNTDIEYIAWWICCLVLGIITSRSNHGSGGSGVGPYCQSLPKGVMILYRLTNIANLFIFRRWGILYSWLDIATGICFRILLSPYQNVVVHPFYFFICFIIILDDPFVIIVFIVYFMSYFIHLNIIISILCIFLQLVFLSTIILVVQHIFLIIRLL